ncbi:RNA polymerase Rpb4 [Apiospora saccharicola]|uniref:RNA polymerase Rpb4 n=1 Tax=Apiospora saccharicola TaxID=335842 RepID=A0ABR1WHI4_9PEZI
MASQHQQTARTKPVPAGNEEASSELHLGEFQDVDTLSLSEASLLLNAISENRRKGKGEAHETEMLSKTIDYLDAFSRFKNKENVEAVERLLGAYPQFHKFERAQLGSLCCDNAEEAKTLIPSLQDKISDNELDDLLNEVGKFMNQ